MNLIINENLPEGWIQTYLKNISEIIMGQSPSSSTYNNKKLGIPFFQGKKNFGDKFPIPTVWCSKPKKIAEQGHILITVRAPVGTINWCVEQCCIGRGIAAINVKINSEYIYYFLKSIKERLSKKGSGSIFNAISKNELSIIYIPVPPLNEQKRIVIKIESIFTQIDAIEKHQKLILGMLDKLRTSVLKQAFEGKLVPQDPNDEPVSTLLKKLELKQTIKNSERMNISKGWIQTYLKNISEIIMGQSPSSSTYNNKKLGIPFFQGKKNFGDKFPIPTVWCSKPKKIAEQGHILITVRAPVGTINWCVEQCCIGRGIAAINVKINSEYIYYFLKSIKERLSKKGSGSIFNAISKNELSIIYIPVPPLNEQKRIVIKIESIFTQIDAIEKHQKLILGMLDKLRTSVLKQAFEGKLVPQDPNDESAMVLLEKIKKIKNHQKNTNA